MLRHIYMVHEISKHRLREAPELLSTDIICHILGFIASSLRHTEFCSDNCNPLLIIIIQSSKTHPNKFVNWEIENNKWKMLSKDIW